MHRRFLTAAFAAAALVALAAPVASAVPPTRADWVASDSEVVDWLCPFPVVGSYTIDWHEVHFYDSDGDMVRLSQHLIVHTTFSANGKSAVGEGQVVNATGLFGPGGGDTYVVWRVSRETFRLPDGTKWTGGGAGLMSWDYTTETLKVTPGMGQTDDTQILCDALAP